MSARENRIRFSVVIKATLLSFKSNQNREVSYRPELRLLCIGDLKDKLTDQS
jgi:hypothetical protein